MQISRWLTALSFSVCLTTLALPASAQAQLSALVHPLIGTAGDGQTFPGAGMPFGMTQWTPATRLGEDKCISPYYFADTRIYGIRGSHFMSGSCTQDYGSLQLIAGMGEPDLSSGPPSSSFSHDHERATPYEYSADLPDFATTVSATGSLRAGILRFQMHRAGQAWLLVENDARAGDGEIRIDPDRQEITGYNRVRRLYAGQGQLAGFSGYFVVRFERHFRVGGTAIAKAIHPGELLQQATSPMPGAYVFFDVQPEEVLLAKVGTSFTSIDEARHNLEQEIPNWSFDQVRDRARSAWEQALGAITVEPSSADAPIFYTALYHSMQLPRIFSDASGAYPRFAGGVTVEHAKGFTYYCDFSAWDTFRALHPLLTIIDPQRDSEMVQSLIAKGQQGGFLPIFPSWNSYTSEMVGDHGTAIIGDAYLKGIRGFDIQEAYRLMRQNALELPTTEAAYKDGQGRRALKSYLQYGYVPLDDTVPDAFHRNEQVSRTLEYAYDDFVLGEVAKSLNKTADSALFAQRAQNYRNVIDPETGFARGRYANGTWSTPFDPAKPYPYITEGIPFQYTFFVPQDMAGLIALEHGPTEFIRKLDELFARKLYDHGNEPSHHIAYLYDYAGAAWKTQAQVRSIMASQYSDRPAGLAGNDDAGQMSAWYVMSALGLYQVAPGKPVYAIGAPIFPKTTIRLPNGKSFRIVAEHLAADAPYIQSATLNGKSLNRFWIRHAEVIAGGELRFRMGREPNKKWPATATLP